MTGDSLPVRAGSSDGPSHPQAQRVARAAAGDAAERRPVLREGYRRCAAITRRYGTTYYWGTILLPRESRGYVHAVYALCRAADDIVDAPGATLPANVQLTQRRLASFAASFDAALKAGTSDNPVLAAIVDAVGRAGIPRECFTRFFGAMAQDLVVDRYETWQDLLGYMEGSAAVIGEMMLPVLRPRSPAAFEPARSLGLAFQLTNFLRDVGEDLDRGRVYLPQADLRAHGADPTLRRVTPEWRSFLAEQIERNRELYRIADVGIPELPPASARCVRTARRLYAQILDLIEAADYDVFGERLRVPTSRKAVTAAVSLLVEDRVGA